MLLSNFAAASLWAPGVARALSAESPKTGKRVFTLSSLTFAGRAMIDHAAAGTAQGFVGGAGHDVGVRNGAGMGSSGDKPGYMSGVDQEFRTDLIRYLTEAREIDDARIRSRAADDEIDLSYVASLRFCVR